MLNCNKTAAMESNVRPQKEATALSKMQKHQTLRIESFSSEESPQQQNDSEEEDDKLDESKLPLSSIGLKSPSLSSTGKSSTASIKSSEDEEDEEDEGSSSEDWHLEDKSGQSNGSNDDSLAQLNGPDDEPFTADHYEDNEQEKGEREWQPEDVPRDGLPPHGKWPTAKYASFLRLRLPDLHEKLVVVVPGIGTAAAVRLSKRGIDTVCYVIYSYLTC